jgi:hypothetical protein
MPHRAVRCRVTDHSTTLSAADTQGLGRLEFEHPIGTFALTPASLISLTAIVSHQHLLHGVGLDWGSGVGCLAIAAARVPTVDMVLGLEISPDNVAAAHANANHNGVADKTRFLVADGYTPRDHGDGARLEPFVGRVEFIIANPPASEGDDGFEFRRIVLRGARNWLRPGAVVFLNVSYQYGIERLHGLTEDAPGFHYESVLASTDWVPFDLTRPDLLLNLQDYVAEEEHGGRHYTFQDPAAQTERLIDARTALEHFRRTGQSPLSKWQTHLFRYQP